MIKFGSLFTGVGGFDLGFERSGMGCSWQVEWDLHCQDVLNNHWKDVRRYNDVRDVGKRNLEPVELICGGFPCQDLSVAGKRAGFAGERSSLWYEYQRIVDEMRPQWVVIENVPGLLSSRGGADFAVILKALDEFGYGVAWRVLDSQYFGVPQRRRRVFIVASLGNMRCGQVLFESESMSGDFAPSKEKRENTTRPTVSSIEQRCYKGINADNLDHMVANWTSGGGKMDDSKVASLRNGAEHNYQFLWQGQHQRVYNLHQNDDKRKDRPNGGLYIEETDKSLTVQTGQGKSQTVLCIGSSEVNVAALNDLSPVLTCRHDRPFVAIGHSGGETLKVNEKVNTLNSQNSQTGSESTAMFNGVWQMNHADEAYRDCGEISPTLQSRMGTGGNNVPLIGVRRLTPTECERLQGFPDGWTATQSDTHRYKQMGNAVTVNVIEWIGKRIVEFTRDG